MWSEVMFREFREGDSPLIVEEAITALEDGEAYDFRRTCDELGLFLQCTNRSPPRTTLACHMTFLVSRYLLRHGWCVLVSLRP